MDKARSGLLRSGMLKVSMLTKSERGKKVPPSLDLARLLCDATRVHGVQGEITDVFYSGNVREVLKF